MYSYASRMSLVCTHMSLVYTHPYVTRMYSYVIPMSLVYTWYVIRMSLVCGLTMNLFKLQFRNKTLNVTFQTLSLTKRK